MLCLSGWLSFAPSFFIFFANILSIYSSVRLFISPCVLFVCLSFFLSVCPSVRPSVWLFVCLSVYLSLFVSFFVVCLSDRPSVCQSVRLSVCWSACLSVCLFIVSFVVLNYGILFQMRSKHNSLISNLVNILEHSVSTIAIKTCTSFVWMKRFRDDFFFFFALLLS